MPIRAWALREEIFPKISRSAGDHTGMGGADFQSRIGFPLARYPYGHGRCAGGGLQRGIFWAAYRAAAPPDLNAARFRRIRGGGDANNRRHRDCGDVSGFGYRGIRLHKIHHPRCGYSRGIPFAAWCRRRRLRRFGVIPVTANAPYPFSTPFPSTQIHMRVWALLRDEQDVSRETFLWSYSMSARRRREYFKTETMRRQYHRAWTLLILPPNCNRAAGVLQRAGRGARGWQLDRQSFEKLGKVPAEGRGGGRDVQRAGVKRRIFRVAARGRDRSGIAKERREIQRESAAARVAVIAPHSWLLLLPRGRGYACKSFLLN